MRPGDYITVNRTEVQLLTSDEFRQLLSEEVSAKILLTEPEGPAQAGYKCLSLPKIGRPVADALRHIASAGPSPESVVAEHLAERIEHRVAHRRGAG
jgi:hypothetical protein